MIRGFKSILQVAEYFQKEETCRKYLANLRWENGEAVCPHCESEKVYSIENGKRYKCANKDCYKKFSVTSGTIFENSKIPLRKWFIAIFVMSNHKKGISSCQLARDIDVTQKTAWFMLHRIREMLEDKEPELLDGEVETDEAFVGGNLKNKHPKVRRKLSKKYGGNGYLHRTPVLGMLKRGGKVRGIVIEKAVGKEIKPIMFAGIKKESTVITDGFGGYYGIDKTFKKHVIVNHQKGEYVTGKDFHTNTIEGFWSQLKRGIIGIYHVVSKKHLQKYVNEFSFRYNTRKMQEDDRFNTVIGLSKGRRLRYDRLIGNL